MTLPKISPFFTNVSKPPSASVSVGISWVPPHTADSCGTSPTACCWGRLWQNTELTSGCWPCWLFDFHGLIGKKLEPEPSLQRLFQAFLNVQDCKFASRPFERCCAKPIFLEKKLLVTSINFTFIRGRGGFPGMHINK